MCKRNSSQSLVPVDPDGQMGFMVRAHPHQTETLRDADLDHQSQRITRLLMRWCLCLPAKNLSSSFLQDAEISAFELRSILNKILAKRKYMPQQCFSRTQTGSQCGCERSSLHTARATCPAAPGSCRNIWAVPTYHRVCAPVVCVCMPAAYRCLLFQCLV